MNFGSDLLTWFLAQAQPLVILAIIIGLLFVLFSRKITNLAVTLGIGIFAVGVVYNYEAVKDLFLSLFNQIFGT